MDDAETRVNTNDYSFVTDIYTNLKQLQWRRLGCMQLWPTKYVGHFAADGVLALEVAAQFLFAFDSFEEGFEVALAKAAAALALDNLVEDGRTVFDGTSEDLEHVAFVVAVDEDAEFFEFVDGFVDLADAGLQLGVIGVGDGEEVDSLLLHLGDGGEYVVGGEGHVLDAGAAVEVEVLLDLGLAPAFGWLVDGEFDVAVAVGHHLGHEGGVFGGDVAVVEVLVEAEAHDVAVEVDPLVHGVPADVADDVVDVEEADGTGNGVFGNGLIAGEESSGVVGAFYEGVDGIAIGGDAGGGDAAVGVFEVGGSLDAPGSAAGGGEPGLTGVIDPEGDGADAVAVGVDVGGDVGVGAEGGGEDEAYLALLEDVAGAVALTGLGACIGDEGHTKGGTVEVGGLSGVAYEEFDVVGAFEGEEVGGCGGVGLVERGCGCCHGGLRFGDAVFTADHAFMAASTRIVYAREGWLRAAGRMVARHSPRPMRGWPGASQEPESIISSWSSRKVRVSPVGRRSCWAPF
jgi:hypothetical protein